VGDDVVARFPLLPGRLFTMSIPGGRASATFRDPATARLLREHVHEILGLRLDASHTPGHTAETSRESGLSSVDDLCRYGDCRSRRSRMFITMLRMATTTSVQSAMPSAQEGVISIPVTSVTRS
jgi:hypothetical protein